MGIVLLLSVCPAFGETLGDALRQYGLTSSSLPPGHTPDRDITSYAIVSDSGAFSIAYYFDDASGTLRPPLNVLRFDRSIDEWRGTTIDESALGAENRHCFGSAVAGYATRQAIYFTTHITPSASCTLIFSEELNFETALYGWFLAAFPDGVVVYHNSQVHFAPTHSAELSLYDPGTGQSRKIYPIAPIRAIREEHIRRLRVIYDDPAWCNQRNHHCDAESFDNAIHGDVSINDATDSLAFVASFDNAELAGADGLVEPPAQVLYVYRDVRDPARIAYRELLLEDFRARFGDQPIDGALIPAVLDELFRN